MHLALDHLTVSDAYPWELVELAARNRLAGCCLFLQSMSVIPHMPAYDLVADADARKRTKVALAACRISLDLAYPFTVTGRSRSEDFLDPMDAAADLGAKAINLLVYDRDEARRTETVAAIARMASARGMTSVIEFYPSSAIKSFADAAKLVRGVGYSDLGINVDLLHLYRSGGRVAELEQARDLIRFAQLADAPLASPDDPDFEAAQGRMAISDGELPVSAFLQTLPREIPLSLEVPRDADIEAGMSKADRAALAIAPFKRAVAVQS